MDQPTGLDLKLERIRRGVKSKDVAAAMGIGRTRVSELEGQLRPAPAKVERYRDALQRLSAA